jgi:hypothetical protein
MPESGVFLPHTPALIAKDLARDRNYKPCPKPDFILKVRFRTGKFSAEYVFLWFFMLQCSTMWAQFSFGLLVLFCFLVQDFSLWSLFVLVAWFLLWACVSGDGCFW